MSSTIPAKESGFGNALVFETDSRAALLNNFTVPSFDVLNFDGCQA